MVNDPSFICTVQIHGFNGCDISGVSQLILAVCFIATVEEEDCKIQEAVNISSLKMA